MSTGTNLSTDPQLLDKQSQDLRLQNQILTDNLKSFEKYKKNIIDTKQINQDRLNNIQKYYQDLLTKGNTYANQLELINTKISKGQSELQSSLELTDQTDKIVINMFNIYSTIVIFIIIIIGIIGYILIYKKYNNLEFLKNNFLK